MQLNKVFKLHQRKACTGKIKLPNGKCELHTQKGHLKRCTKLGLTQKCFNDIEQRYFHEAQKIMFRSLKK